MARRKSTKAPSLKYLDNGQICYTDPHDKRLIVQYPHELPDAYMASLTPATYERLYRHVRKHAEAIGRAIRPVIAQVA